MKTIATSVFISTFATAQMLLNYNEDPEKYIKYLDGSMPLMWVVFIIGIVVALLEGKEE